MGEGLLVLCFILSRRRIELAGRGKESDGGRTEESVEDVSTFVGAGYHAAAV